MLRRHLFLDAGGAEAGDLAGDEDLLLVERITEIVIGVAADDERTGLSHEAAHMADAAADDDVDALHRDAAARAGIALDDEHAAASRGAGRLRGVAGDA